MHCECSNVETKVGATGKNTKWTYGTGTVRQSILDNKNIERINKRQKSPTTKHEREQDDNGQISEKHKELERLEVDLRAN